MQYKVYEVDEKMTRTGKAMKKLVLQGEGKQYLDKNVTMWADHPLFEDTVPGETIDVDLDIRDSATPNPKGGFYKDKTVLKPGFAPKAAEKAPQHTQPDSQDSRIMNALTLKVIPLLENIRKDQMAILEEMKLHTPYPEMNETNDAHSFDEEKITKSDVPF